MLIQARHPAIVRHVPARARKERIELAATVTPVSLPEADPSEFPEAGTLRPGDAWRALRIHAHAGGIWSRLDEGHGHKTLARRPTAGDLAAFLEGRAEPEVAAALARTFRRTPLVACGAGPQDGLFEHGYADATGAEIDLERSRRVDLDGRTAASAELVAWLGENVRIVGGEPFVRRIPLLEVSCNTEVAGLRVEEGAMTTGFRTLVTTPEGLEATLALAARMGSVPQGASRDVEGWRSLVPEAAVAAGDARRVLNAFAGSVRASLDEKLEWLSRPADVEATKAVRDRLLGLELKALTGMAHAAGEADGLRLVAEGLELHLRLKRSPGDHGQAHLLAHIRENLIPRLDLAADADIETFNSLLPR